MFLVEVVGVFTALISSTSVPFGSFLGLLNYENQFRLIFSEVLGASVKIVRREECFVNLKNLKTISTYVDFNGNISYKNEEN